MGVSLRRPSVSSESYRSFVHDRLTKSFRYQNNTTIRVIVGSAEASFNVHKNFVCNASPFFEGACNSLFKEALNDEVYLPDADPEAFDIFMEWVYTKRIRLPRHPPDKGSKEDGDAWWILLAKMYLLAHYLQSTSFGNAVTDFVGRSISRKQVIQNPQCDVIDLVYNSTIGDCGLRRIFVALTVWRTMPACWEEESNWRSHLRGLPAEYSHDLVIKLQRKNHELEKDPFLNERTCQVFWDTELGCQAVKPAVNTENQACPPVGK